MIRIRIKSKLRLPIHSVENRNMNFLFSFFSFFNNETKILKALSHCLQYGIAAMIIIV